MRGANVSEGNYTLRWANAIPSDTAAYQLVFLDYATGGYVAQSAVFNLTLPPGEVRNMSAGSAPASPGTTVAESKPSTSLSAGELAAAIVVPILSVTAILIGAIYLWRRKRRQRSKSSEDGGLRKAELDASDRAISKPGHQSAELPDESARAGSILKHQSAELNAEKDFIKWELPITPTQRSADPVEMPAEVPLAEMSANENASDNGTIVAGSTSAEDKISPLLTQNEFAQNGGARNGRLPVTIEVPVAHRRIASPTTDRTRFQEALYDIISDELRRPGDSRTKHTT